MKLSLTTKTVVLGAAAILVPTALSVLVGWRLISTAFLDLAQRHLQTETNLLIDEIDKRVTQMGARTQLLSRRVAAQTQLIFDLDRQLSDPLPLHSPAADQLIQTLSTQMPPGERLAVLDLSDTVIAAADPSQVGRHWIASEVLAQGRVSTTTSGPLRANEKLALLALGLTPIRTTVGRVVAVLVDYVEAPMETRLWPLGSEVSVVHIRDAHRRTVLARGTDDQQTANPQHDPNFITVRTLIFPGGGEVILGISREKALEPLTQVSPIVLSLLAAFGAALLLMLWYVTVHITGPITRLADVAVWIGQGHLQSRTPTPRSDEIGDLDRALDHMRSNLLAQRELLEQRLETRTLALQREREITASLFEVLPEIVLVLDAQKHISVANPAAQQILGQEIQGQTCYQALFHLEQACARCPWSNLESGQAQLTFDRQRPLFNNELLTSSYLPIMKPVIEKGTQLDAVIFSGRIVTDEHRVQAQMAHQEKMAAVGVLAAGVAHEIGNPLASMAALALLRERKSTDPSQQKEWAGVRVHVERIRKILSGLRNAARPTPSGMQLFSAADVIRQAVDLVRYDPRARNLRWVLQISSSVPAVLGDPDALMQVLINVLLNSLDAIEEQPEPCIELSCQQAAAGDPVKIVVADTGCGMDPQLLGHTTDPFFTTKPAGKGTGLGLFVSARLVEHMRGRFEINSVLGQGTTVTVSLPCHDNGGPKRLPS